MSMMLEPINSRYLLDYLKSLKVYLLTATLMMLIPLVMGVVMANFWSLTSSNVILDIGEFFEWIRSLTPPEMTLMIFLNNAVKSLLVIILGVGFGLVPVIFLTFNGMLIGVVIGSVAKIEGIMFVAKAILPHGVLELPMIIISSAIGLRIGRTMINAIGGADTDIMCEIRNAMRMFIYFIMPLLLIAAIIEAYITAALVL